VRLREQRLVVGLALRKVLVSEHRTARGRELLLEHVGEALTVRLVIVDDERLLQPELAREAGAGRTLLIVGRAHAEERVRGGMRRAQLRSFVALRQAGIRGRGTDLHEPRVVRDRNLRLRDARVERTDHRENRIVGNELLHVLRALRGIVRALHSVVEIVCDE
jgi:hypothetical protein